MNLTESEMRILLPLLKRAYDELGGNGCGDFTIPYTPENEAIVDKAHKLYTGEDFRQSLSKSTLTTQDFELINYFIHRIKKELPK